MQASLYLRRIGFSTELAVLDRHVVDFLKLSRRSTAPSQGISRLPAYEAVETEFTAVAAEMGHSVGCVDLAVWVTMRVAKREARL